MEAPRDTGPTLRQLSDEEKTILEPMTESEAQRVLDTMNELLIEPSDIVSAKEMVTRLVALNILRVNIPAVEPVFIDEESLSAAS